MIAATIKAAVPTMVRKCRGDRLIVVVNNLTLDGGMEGALPWIRAVVSFFSRTEMLCSPRSLVCTTSDHHKEERREERAESKGLLF